MRKLTRHRFLLAALIVLCAARAAYGIDEAEERRVRSGLRLFRAILAADEDISGKADSTGSLLLLAVYDQNRALAEDFATELRELGRGDERGRIRGLPIEVRVTNDLAPSAETGQTPAGILIVEDLSDERVVSLAQFGIENHVIVYSPFEGDVDRGILGGLAIETRVRPYINMHTLRESKIRIKEFFLKVAKTYEP